MQDTSSSSDPSESDRIAIAVLRLLPTTIRDAWSQHRISKSPAGERMWIETFAHLVSREAVPELDAPAPILGVRCPLCSRAFHESAPDAFTARAFVFEHILRADTDICPIFVLLHSINIRNFFGPPGGTSAQCNDVESDLSPENLYYIVDCGDVDKDVCGTMTNRDRESLMTALERLRQMGFRFKVMNDLCIIEQPVAGHHVLADLLTPGTLKFRVFAAHAPQAPCLATFRINDREKGDLKTRFERRLRKALASAKVAVTQE